MRSSASTRKPRELRYRGAIVALCALALTAVVGSQALGAPARSADDKMIVLIPKQTGDPFFADVRTGATEAAKRLGYEINYVGPATADAAGQVSTIQNVTQLRPAAITIAANDPNAVAPALKAA